MERREVLVMALAATNGNSKRHSQTTETNKFRYQSKRTTVLGYNKYKTE
jgi:hypothetical protein